jgi:hypothetical protein
VVVVETSNLKIGVQESKANGVQGDQVTSRGNQSLGVANPFPALTRPRLVGLGDS